jgi:hypothetical protein
MKRIFGFCFASLLFALIRADAADINVDFSKVTGRIRPELHSSGCAPRLYPRAVRNDDLDIKAMGCYATRTHDWALWNCGQRIVDTHFIFPLMHLDPKDPKNYYFKATDEVLKYSKNIDLKILYRLGASIEHTGDVHFNVLDPEDHDKYAEVLAGIMRHYLKGWADGFYWADVFQGWEIWNEPDGTTNCYVIPECKEKDWLKRMDLHKPRFCNLFATVLKRLKSEFPDQQIGGPAMIDAREPYFRTLLKACKDKGVAPDFISWHGYTSNPESLIAPIAKMRALLDEFGFTKTRMIIDEWHYLLNSNWDGVHGGVPVAYRRAHEGPSGLYNIDSAVFNVYVLSRFQDTVLDEAYWYGSNPLGNWGWLKENGTLNKCWYSMKLFGDFVKTAKTKVLVSVDGKKSKHVAAVAGLSSDGKRASLVVCDYQGGNDRLYVEIKGLDNIKNVSAVILDHTRDLSPVSISFNDGIMCLPRFDENSAAFLVTFECAEASK